MTAVITAAVYFAAISAYSAAVTVTDKKRAQSGGRRIPERQLFAAAALGGSFVMYAVMRRIRHKTKHKRFMIGLPAIMLLQLCAAAAFQKTFYGDFLKIPNLFPTFKTY